MSADAGLDAAGVRTCADIESDFAAAAARASVCGDDEDCYRVPLADPYRYYSCGDAAPALPTEVCGYIPLSAGVNSSELDAARDEWFLEECGGHDCDDCVAGSGGCQDGHCLLSF